MDAEMNSLKAIDKMKTTLKQKKLTLSLEESLEWWKQLKTFPLGRSLLEKKALTGYWTSYVVSRAQGKGGDLSALEKWLVEKAPAAKATQDRFAIFQKWLAIHVKEGMKIASIPSGVMDDLLSLKAKKLTLIGVDIDPESLKLAKERSLLVSDNCFEFYQEDAWSVRLDIPCDIIVSNGLNIYVQDDKSLIELYRSFYKNLKPGGKLLTSFLTPPPNLSKESTWKNFSVEDLKIQQAIFVDIIEAKWQRFRTPLETEQHLRQVGFKDIKFIFDEQGMFPTVVCRK